MTQSKPSEAGFLNRNRFKLQALALVVILTLPFLLYAATQSGRNAVITLLLGVMTLAMLAVTAIS